MTKQEAIEAMKNGAKVTHRYFSEDEYIKFSEDGRIETEEGYLCAPSLFWIDRRGEAWQDGWSIYGESEKSGA